MKQYPERSWPLYTVTKDNRLVCIGERVPPHARMEEAATQPPTLWPNCAAPSKSQPIGNLKSVTGDAFGQEDATGR